MESNNVRTAEKQPQTHKRLLALMPADPSLPAEGEVVGSFALVAALAKKIEPVGKFYAKLQGKFHRLHQRQQIAAGKGQDAKGRQIVVEDSEGEDSNEDGADQEERKGAEDYQKKRKKRTKADIEKEALLMGDLYAILGLEDKLYESSDAEIGKAYKKAALLYHPDKLGDKLTQKDKDVWLQIQTAYETLSDPIRRRKYDSSLPFDEKTPEEGDVNDENFYEVFAKCFQNNAMFSIVKPVPNLGKADSPIEEVRKFYKFWDNFKTWREFSQYDEYDTEDAQDRYEKRWMEKQNRNGRKKYEKEERKRLIDLTDLAYRLDPRIKAELVAEAAAKEAAKKAKKEQKANYYREIEERKQQDEEAARKLKEEAAAKLVSEKEAKKQAAKKHRETIKAVIQLCVSKMPDSKYDKFYLEEFCKKFPEQERIDKLLEGLQQAAAASKNNQAFEAAFLKIHQKSESKHEAEERVKQQKQQEEQKQAKESLGKNDWSADEIALLTKGITKFPPGTSNRWKVVADFVGSKGMKQVISKAKQIQEQYVQAAEEKKQQEAERKDHIEKLKKEAQEEIKTAAAAAAPAKGAADIKQKVVPAAAAADTWTNDQQKGMEKGMREVPASVPTKERWIKIAEGVEGKTAKECFTRFKELCAKTKAQAAK